MKMDRYCTTDYICFYFVHQYLAILFFCFFFFKQKTAYEMVYSDWSSDVCSSDLATTSRPRRTAASVPPARPCVTARSTSTSWGCVMPARSEERRVGKECCTPC